MRHFLLKDKFVLQTRPISESTGGRLMKTTLALVTLLFSTQLFAQTVPSLSYDIGASTGFYNGESYNEMNVGLNWTFDENWTWRNSAYSRNFPSRSASTFGLDTSLRYRAVSDPGAPIGGEFFAGPGYRISDSRDSGAFFEAGLVGRAGGLRIGGGLKAIYYQSPGTNSDGSAKPKSDTTYFITISGGGVVR